MEGKLKSTDLVRHKQQVFTTNIAVQNVGTTCNKR